MAHKWRAYTGLGLLLLMLAQSLLHPSAASACLCGEPRAHDGEFLGTVVSVQDSTNPGLYRVTFQVLNAWSGVNTSYVVVRTGDCGPTFHEGVTYLVNVDH